MHSYEECLNAIRKKYNKPIRYSFEYKKNYIFYVCMTGSLKEQTFGNSLYEVNAKTLEITEFRNMYDSLFVTGDAEKNDILEAFNATVKPVDTK